MNIFNIISRFLNVVLHIIYPFSSIFLLVLLIVDFSMAQTPTAEWWRIMRKIEPEKYLCHRAQEALVIDGKIDEASWIQVPWTKYFGNLGTKTIESYQQQTHVPRLKTRVKMLWDDHYFYIAADLEEPHVWGTFLWHDQIVCLENNFEVFIDANGDNHNYIELEINALNTVWDLVLDKPYRDKCKPDQAWNISGLKKAVFVDGTLNNPKDIDKGWSIEMAIPWDAVAEYSDCPCPPMDEAHWRVNFARTEYEHEIITSNHTTKDVKNNAYQKKENGQLDIWSWRSHGVRNLHTPEMLGIVQFTRLEPGQSSWIPDAAADARLVLLEIYYAQRDYFNVNEKYASDLKSLDLKKIKAKMKKWKLSLTP